MAHEIELKFDLEPDGVALVRAAPALATAPFDEEVHDTVYFDTKDGALRRAGFSVRVRRSGDRHVQTVKRKRGASAGLYVRQEWESEVAGFELDRKALRRTPAKRLLATLPTDSLVPLVRTRFRRTSWTIERKSSRIEVVLDEGNVTSGRMKAPLLELELELKAGKPRFMFQLAAELGEGVPLRLGILSKAERGYALAERRLGRCARAEPVDLVAPLSEGEAFRAVAHVCLRHYRLNEIVLLAERDAAALHQARIALRRLRSALSLFRAAVRGKEYQALREEIAWLAGQLGDARDADVMLAGEAERGDHHLLRDRLTRMRGKAYDRVETTLHSERVRALMLRLALWIELGAWRFRQRSARDVSALAADQLERQWRKVQRHAHRIAKASGAERHRLRLDVKKLRYSAEFLGGLYASRARLVARERFVAALKALQDRLGELTDAEAADALAARLAPGSRVSAERIRRKALADEAIAAAQEELERASAAAGYWR